MSTANFTRLDRVRRDGFDGAGIDPSTSDGEARAAIIAALDALQSTQINLSADEAGGFVAACLPGGSRTRRMNGRSPSRPPTPG